MAIVHHGCSPFTRTCQPPSIAKPKARSSPCRLGATSTSCRRCWPIWAAAWSTWPSASPNNGRSWCSSGRKAMTPGPKWRPVRSAWKNGIVRQDGGVLDDILGGFAGICWFSGLIFLVILQMLTCGADRIWHFFLIQDLLASVVCSHHRYQVLDNTSGCQILKKTQLCAGKNEGNWRWYGDSRGRGEDFECLHQKCALDITRSWIFWWILTNQWNFEESLGYSPAIQSTLNIKFAWIQVDCKVNLIAPAMPAMPYCISVDRSAASVSQVLWRMSWRRCATPRKLLIRSTRRLDQL